MKIDSNQDFLDACKEENLETVKLLLEQGADVNAVATNGKTVLMMTCAKGYTDIVKLLVNNGADMSKIDENGDTAFTIACKGDFMEIIEFLRSKGGAVCHCCSFVLHNKE